MKTPEYLKPFMADDELALADSFLQRGFIKGRCEDLPCLDALRTTLVKVIADVLQREVPQEAAGFLNSFHEQVSAQELNAVRLSVIAKMNQDPTFRGNYYRLAKLVLNDVVGNELAMQRFINLSIQMPEDSSSLLEPHADNWSGDPYFEVVLWIPMVDCADSKSIYLLPLDAPNHTALQQSVRTQTSSAGLYDLIADEVEYLSVDYGEFVLFSPNLIHGNRVNQVPETRWSFNCRFKNITTPYRDKPLIEFFEPIQFRPATRLGMHFQQCEEAND